MATLKEVLGDSLYNDAFRAADNLNAMGVSVSKMTREDLVVAVALLIREIQRHPTHAAELSAYAASVNRNRPASGG